ncbi:hypothetical protein [Streptomyces violascens]|uniref:hypothetical protein n=1 Tax=Streptomyces violascens TaxID=67381 RepID=UPI001673788E|nr:hypothetical protein [Streptomyces violascens]GGU47745.1 hypothetical protein GCM10010289_80460 [Streptomyces violascens]
MNAGRMMAVGIAVLAVLAGWPTAASEEPCRINTDAAVIREQPSKTAAKAGISYRDQTWPFPRLHP